MTAYVSVILRLTPEQAAKVKDAAEKTKSSQQDVMRQCIDSHIAKVTEHVQAI